MKTNKHYERVKEIVDVLNMDDEIRKHMNIAERFEFAAKIMLAELLGAVADNIENIRFGD